MIRPHFRGILFLCVYAVCNTTLSFGIIHIINNVLSGTPEFLKGYMIITFTSMVVYAYLLNVIFQKFLNKYTFNILYENEKKLFRQILKAPLRTLENHGSQRFYTAMEDLRLFSRLPYTLTHTVTSIMMLFLGVVYMYRISGKSASIVLLLIVVVSALYFLVMKFMSGVVAVLRKQNEFYYNYVKDLIDGFKELKISLVRQDNIMKDHVGPNRDISKQLDFEVNYVFLSINMLSQYGLYLVIGAILFGLPELGLLNREDVIAYVLVLLFISGPINNLVNLQQIYTRFLVANNRLKSFKKEFEIKEVEKKPDLEFLEKDLSSISFKDVEFNYQGNENSEFSLGPVNLKIERGETIFIVGGNGSGKSTFINVLCGLYPPTKGNIYIDDKIATTATIQNLISAIFTNNHIFSQNYDNYQLSGNKNYESLIKRMRLEKVINDDSEKAARKTLSKGQSKRMSMIFSLLEDKPILVLDEWAADQDPHFRKFFYTTLLPDLKKQGKTVIAVTHDDAYFHTADRVIKFDYGKISKYLDATVV